ncbi:MAG: TRAP transporter large permease [Dysosmobacter sp.]|nr:TRAP transporter large permease [Dysosmobacter sp.]
MSGVALLFILLIGLMMASVPVGISLGLSTLVTMVLTTNLDVITIPQYCFRGLDSFPLMAIPFFMLAGNLMKFGGLSEKLINLSNSLVRGFKGGLGHVTVLASMFFAALSGSAPATVMAIGSNVIPQMEKHGYDRGYATALASTAGTIGVIIPPSIPFVIYGVVSGASISDLFVAGIIPGILIGIVLMVVNYIYARKYGYGGEGRASFREFLHELKDAIWALLVPVIILGGIYGGIFTPTESAVVAVVYTLIIGFVVYKELTWKKVWDAFMETGALNGTTTFMVGLSMSFAAYLTLAGIPSAVGQAILSLDAGPVVILLLINVVLLVVGCFVDNISSTIILTPILLPIAQGVGMTAVQFGIVMTVNLAIGFITPPYGVNLFYGSAIGKVSIEELSKKILPFIGAMIICLLLLTFIEPLSMWLPTLMAAKAG